MAKRAHNTTGNALLVWEGRKIALEVCQRRCPICGVKMHLCGRFNDSMEVDHIIPDHSRVVGNLVPLCKSCNASKQDQDLASWLPGYLLGKIEDIETITGARRAATFRMRKIEALRQELTARLVEAGIWSDE